MLFGTGIGVKDYFLRSDAVGPCAAVTRTGFETATLPGLSGLVGEIGM